MVDQVMNVNQRYMISFRIMNQRYKTQSNTDTAIKHRYNTCNELLKTAIYMYTPLTVQNFKKF